MKIFIRVSSFLFIFSSVYSVFDSGGAKVRNQRSIDFLRLLRKGQSSEVPAQSQTNPQFSSRQARVPNGYVQDSNQHFRSVGINDQVPKYEQVYSQYSGATHSPQVSHQSVNQITSERQNNQNLGFMTTMIRRFMHSMAQFLGVQNTVRNSDARKINKQVARINAENGKP
jgi:hypothetical protein